MYWLFGVFFVILLILMCLQLFRRHRMICKVKRMEVCARIDLLNRVLSPFGFCYLEEQDIISSTLDAWQRQFGYRSLYDDTALGFSMVFDCEPVYFYYKNRTYRIELWKGQYGMNTGAEIGIYYAEGIIDPGRFDTAWFQCVPEEELLMLKMELYYKGQKLYGAAGMHWWLTGFDVGRYCEPEDLMLWASIGFTDPQMLSCFVEGLRHLGYQKCDIIVREMAVSFSFGRPFAKQPRARHRLRVSFAQWKNRFFCRLFLRVTRHFSCTLDRLLYLYFYLPPAFRHLCLRRKNRRQKFRRRGCCQKPCRKHCHQKACKKHCDKKPCKKHCDKKSCKKYCDKKSCPKNGDKECQGGKGAVR